MTNEILLRNIDLFCTAKKIKKADLLRDLDLPSGSIANWKSRNNLPSVETVYNIANYFNVPMEYLLLNEQKNIDEDIVLSMARLMTLNQEQRKPIIDLIAAQVDYWYKYYNSNQ